MSAERHWADDDPMQEAFDDYATTLTERGLWWTPLTPASAEVAAARVRTQLEVGARHDLPFGWLDRQETALHAQRLTEVLLDVYAGTGRLRARRLFDLLYRRPNHPRDLPRMVLALVLNDAVCEADEAELLTRSWVSTEFPEHNGTREAWVCAFDRHRPLTDNDAALVFPLTLYRSAHPDYADGMAWTGDPDVARQFARRFGDGGEVWATTVENAERWRVLAHFVGRGEDEYVLDTDDMAIHPYAPHHGA